MCSNNHLKQYCMKKLIGLVSGMVILVIACSKDDDGGTNNPPGGTVDCSTISATFTANVSPLITSSCAKSGCHAAGSTNGVGPLTTYAQISAVKTQIRAAVASGNMPKDATFSATQKATITCWIDAGALNN
jgi:hypothetical protein